MGAAVVAKSVDAGSAIKGDQLVRALLRGHL